MAFIGDHIGARKTDEIHPDQRYYETNLTGKEVNDFLLVDAREYIRERLVKEQIVIFNESHSNNQHRVFVKSMLKDFYDAGFRYIAMEASPARMTRGFKFELNRYPKERIALYFSDPQMANLMREAIDLGITVIPYEPRQKGNREELMAQNIHDSILVADPSAKMIILCGYCHVLESSGILKENCGKEKWMAGYLKEISGIDPFTIDQEVMNERFAYDEHPYYHLFSNVKAPSVVLNKDSSAVELRTMNSVDIYLYHPRTILIEGRPDWLVNQEKVKSSVVNNQTCDVVGLPCLIEAHDINYTPYSIPYDIVELTERKIKSSLILGKGSYKLKISGPNGSVEMPLDVD